MTTNILASVSQMTRNMLNSMLFIAMETLASTVYRTRDISVSIFHMTREILVSEVYMTKDVENVIYSKRDISECNLHDQTDSGR